MALVLIFVLVCVVCVLLYADGSALHSAESLPSNPPPDTHGAHISIVIPARNEAHGISRCLDGALAQTGCSFDVTVIDDASSDDTPAILARYAAEHAPRLQVVAGRPLLPGWVGKCNACDGGARLTRAFTEQAAGSWLLFLDADTRPGPGLVIALLAEARRKRLDALSALPFNELGALSERVILPVFFQFIFAAFPLRRMRNPLMPPDAALANGQCVFVRADVYRAVDGHAAVKDKVLEDVEFAQLLRRSGYRIGLAQGRAHIAVRMYRSFAEIVEGLGKHALAGRRRAGARAFVAVAHLLAIAVAPTLLLLVGVLWFLLAGDTGVPALGAGVVAFAAAQVYWGGVYASMYLQPRWLGLLAPVGALVYLLIAARGAGRALAGRGVRWKGREYAG